jgi:hypothetical protein
MCGATENRLLALVSRQRKLQGYAEVSKKGAPSQVPGAATIEAEMQLLGASEVRCSPAPLIDLEEVFADVQKLSDSSSTSTSTSTSPAANDDDDVLTDWVDVLSPRRDNVISDDDLKAQNGVVTSANASGRDVDAHSDYTGLPLPLLAMQAADDPIIHIDSMPCRSGVVEAVENLVCLVTSVGGHVGWPIGWFPWLHRYAHTHKHSYKCSLRMMCLNFRLFSLSHTYTHASTLAHGYTYSYYVMTDCLTNILSC